MCDLIGKKTVPIGPRWAGWVYPGAMKTVETEQGTYRECIYSPHSLRATCATRLLDLGVDIAKVQDLLGHRHITTTQVYDKRRRSTLESASHDVAY